MTRSLVIVLLLAGCSGPPAKVDPVKPPASAPASRPASQPAPAQARSLPACLFDEKTSIASTGSCPDEPEDMTCDWEFGMHVRPDLPHFALIVDVVARDTRTRLSIPVGGRKLGARAEILTSKVTLRGHVMDNDSYLFSKVPLSLGDAVIASAAARLMWYQSRRGSLQVGVTRVSSFEPAKKARAWLPCKKLSLEDHRADDEEALMRKMAGVGRAQKKVVLHKKKRIPLYSMADKKLQGTLNIDKVVPEKVELIKETADRSLVYVVFDYFVLYGWVPNDAIAKTAAARGDEIGEAYGVGGLGLIGPRGGTCGSAKDLYVEQKDEHHKVGTMGKGVRFFVEARGSEWSRIDLETVSWFQMVKGYHLYIKTNALGDCEVRRSKP